MIPASTLVDQSTIAAQIDHDPRLQDYRTFFALLDWSVVEQWEAERSSRGRPPHPMSASLTIFLLRIREGMLSTTHLRRFVLRHPFLVIALGFRLVLDPSHTYGFDVAQTLPCDYRLRETLRTVDPALLQALLHTTFHALQDEIPGLGETVAFDVTPIFAWVQENHERADVTDRYDTTRQPKGDPDCRLGVTRSTTQELPDGSTTEQKELLWGSGTGIAVSPVAEDGTVVLAACTQPFNENDITSVRLLHHQAVLAIQHVPPTLTGDAAFDAWSVYEAAARHAGVAAVPLARTSNTPCARLADGTPLCPIGLPMHPTILFNHTYGYRSQRFQCPLLFPEHTDQNCEHEQFATGNGCVTDVTWDKGGMQRVTLDRDAPLFRALSTQRTGCERINALAKEKGIERPSVRHGRSVAPLNTLTSLVLNGRTLAHATSVHAALLSTPKGIRYMMYVRLSAELP